jgi:peptidoglycan-associated lipoprotein
MTRKYLCLLSAVFFVFSLLCFCSCAQRMAKQEEQVNDQGGKLGELEERDLGEERDAGLQKREGLTTIYFAFDNYSLSEQAKKTLIKNAAWLMKSPQKEIVIEGHCDERGTDEYNIALGERRAYSAKKYLITLGVNPDQLSTISYGEERPADSGHDEDAWAKNRRADFVM